MQFHPEVRHTVEGDRVLSNFVYGVCGCQGGYRAEDLIDAHAANACAPRWARARWWRAFRAAWIPRWPACWPDRALNKGQLTCVFVDHGLLRKDEAAQVHAHVPRTTWA